MATRPLTSLPLDDHACRDCGGRGTVTDPHPYDYSPGATITRPCNTCRPHRDQAPIYPDYFAMIEAAAAKVGQSITMYEDFSDDYYG